MKFGMKIKALEATMSLFVVILLKWGYKNVGRLGDIRATKKIFAVGCRNENFVGIEL